MPFTPEDFWGIREKDSTEEYLKEPIDLKQYVVATIPKARFLVEKEIHFDENIPNITEWYLIEPYIIMYYINAETAIEAISIFKKKAKRRIKATFESARQYIISCVETDILPFEKPIHVYGNEKSENYWRHFREEQ